MSKKIKFEVAQGIVHANSIRVLQSTSTTLCFSVDFEQKYVDYIGYSFFPRLELTFGADEETLDVTDKEADNTDITIVNFPSKEGSKVHVAVDMGRYSATVFIIREAESLNRFRHWHDEEVQKEREKK